MGPEKPDRHVWDDGDDLALQAVQELLQLTLVGRHAEIKAVNFVFHFGYSGIYSITSYFSSN